MPLRKMLIIFASAVLAVTIGLLMKWFYQSELKKSPKMGYQTVGQENHIVITPTADCATVESSANDNVGEDQCSALACARRAISSINGLKVRDNDSNLTAAANLKACQADSAAPVTALIVGHGQPATIYTGFGSSAEEGRKRFLAPTNHDDQTLNGQIQKGWGSILAENLGAQNKTSTLMLLGCSTGAGSDAPKFLGEVREDSRAKKVIASAKDVFCVDQTLYFLNEESWLSSPPTALPSQKIVESARTRASLLRFRVAEPPSQERYVEILPLEISEISASIYGDDNAPIILTATEIQEVVEGITSPQPFKDNGCPVALKLGTLTLKFKNDKLPSRTLTVFGSGLLHDLSQTDTNVYYRGSSTFASIWNNIFESRK